MNDNTKSPSKRAKLYSHLPIHLLGRTLEPIIVPIDNHRLLPSVRPATTTDVTVLILGDWIMSFIVVVPVPDMTETAQPPITRRPLHAHARSMTGGGGGGAVLLTGRRGIQEFPFLRHDEFADAVGGRFFLVPVLDATDALPFGFVFVLFHAEECVDEVPVRGFGLVPALQAQVGLLQPLDVLLCRF